jgi:hypothetical protein
MELCSVSLHLFHTLWRGAIAHLGQDSQLLWQSSAFLVGNWDKTNTLLNYENGAIGLHCSRDTGSWAV